MLIDMNLSASPTLAVQMERLIHKNLYRKLD